MKLRGLYAITPDDAHSARFLVRVRAALARLPRKDREALLLVALGQMTSAEAAVVLGLSLSATKMRVHRARKRLATELGNEDDD